MKIHYQNEFSQLRNRRTLRSCAFLIFLLSAHSIADTFQGVSPNIAGRDSFYHFAHAQLYAQRGILDQSFPWAAYSVLRTNNADLWYGFHCLLLPLASTSDAVAGMKLCGVFLPVLMMVLFAWAMHREKVPLPYLWPLLLFVSAPSETYRCLMIRPQVISMGLCALLLSFLGKGKLRYVFLCTLALTFVHETIFWICPLITGVFLFMEYLQTRKWRLKPLEASVLGVAAGIALHPNPIGAIRSLYVQSAGLAIAHLTRQPVDTPGELGPLGLMPFVTKFGPLFFLWFCVIGLFWMQRIYRIHRTQQRQPKRKDSGAPPALRETTLKQTALTLSVFFSALSVFQSARGTDLWAVFAVYFMALVVRDFIRENPHLKSLIAHKALLVRLDVPALMIFLLILSAAYTWPRVTISMQRSGIPPYRMARSTKWLQENTPAGSLVYHADWSQFHELFFWNKHNRYPGGFDPIFLYSYDPHLYGFMRSLYKLQQSAAGNRATLPVDNHQLQDIPRVLQHDFHASYVFVQRKQNPGLFTLLQSDLHMPMVYSDGDDAIFFADGGVSNPVPQEEKAFSYR